MRLLKYPLTHRYWLWNINDFAWRLLTIQIPFGPFGAERGCAIQVVSRCMHFCIHNLLYARLPNCSMGDDWRIVSAKGARIGWRYDHIRCAYMCFHRSENVSHACATSRATWNVHTLWMHFYDWLVVTRL